jgi:peroxiredoxin
MKEGLGKAVVVLIAVFVILLIAGTIMKKNKVDDIRKRISTLPDFTLPAIDGSIFKSSEIFEGPLLVTYFHSECEHCQYEISSLVQSNIPGSGVKILLISYEGSKQIRSFMQQFDMNNDSVFTVLSDTAFVFSELFRTDVIPSNFIYNEDLRLVKILMGETTIETIEKYLKSDDKYQKD